MAGRDRKRRGFTSRTKQRNRALDVIFEADEKSLLDEDSLRDLLAQRQLVSTAQVPIGEFGSRIVEAYAGNIDDVDTIVEASSEDWAMSRMNAVDRSILRAGTAELLYIGTERGQLIPEWASLAREFGADVVIAERGEEGAAEVKELTDGYGAHGVVEAVGNQVSMDQAIASCRPGGHVGYVGVAHDVTLDGSSLFFAEVTLLGGPAPVRRFLPDLIDRILKREIHPGRVFTMRLPLEEAAEGYAAMDERRAIKVLLEV